MFPPLLLFYKSFCLFFLYILPANIYFVKLQISGVPKEHLSKQMPTSMITKYTKAGEINPEVVETKEKPKVAYSRGKAVKLSS